ncbi:MAG: UDP-N-acetylmuramate--L-alanine ligase [Firmicutes bacterium]|nr:UDP-N-acetylmuramate--L-alanine ligase [Bacillota bacterium]
MGDLHFVGAGGAGMSPLAEVYARRGVQVSGCDLRDSAAVRRLRTLGVDVRLGHDPDHLQTAERVVVSRAVPPTEPEVAAARARGLPVLHRAQLLGQLLAREADSVGVVGTHGKTTTTALLTVALEAAGLDPMALVGGEVHQFGGGARVGSGVAVAEVDESDGSLLHVAPWAAVVTSLDLTDHADFYASPEHLEQTFRRFLQGIQADGFAVLCADHPITARMASVPRVPVITYGLGGDGDLVAEVEELRGPASRALVRYGGRRLGRLTLQVPGRYNVANALGAVAIGLQVGISFDIIAQALAAFRGVRRRFEIRGEAEGVLVVDDYAHNPVKVAAVLRAARECWPGRRVVALFQPHRYTRTRTTHAQFADAFRDADQVVITEIYPADEEPIPGVSAALIVDALRLRRPVEFVPSAEEAAERVARLARPGDLVLTLGAGDIWTAADRLLELLRARVRP